MNKKVFKSKLALKGVTIKELSEKTKINYSNLRLKISGKIIFKPSDIQKIKEQLELTPEEVIEIFLS